MIELGVVPAVDGVTGEAGGREARAGVLTVVVGLVAGHAVVLGGRVGETQPPALEVTGRAVLTLVGAEEGESGGGVIEVGVVPAVDGVTGEAGGGEARAGVLTVVVGLVAGHAVVLGGGVGETQPPALEVTGRAVLTLVGAEEGESGGGVIEVGVVPAVDGVTGEAGGGEARAGVLTVVVGLVAGHAVVLGGGVGETQPPALEVTGRAVLTLVGAEEGESGDGVVEVGIRPGVLRVAGEAGGGESRATVLAVVVGLVTGRAILRSCRREQGRHAGGLVAARAAQSLVGSQEGVPSARSEVIEGGCVAPSDGTVTLRTIHGIARSHVVQGLGATIGRCVA